MTIEDTEISSETGLARRQNCSVFHADGFCVQEGINQGESLAVPDDVSVGDRYVLAIRAKPLNLWVASLPGHQKIVAGSEIGLENDVIEFIGRYIFMDDRGNKLIVLAFTLERLLAEEALPDIYILPLSPIKAGEKYTLLKTEITPKNTRLNDNLCISMARGTKITLFDGRQCHIEDLSMGDMILSRDHGPVPLRWIGRITLMAAGSYAPVVISAGTMGNNGDLIVSQHHRLFIYQRTKSHTLPSSEVLVQARHLVNDSSIYIREGAFVDYFSLAFDRHEIIYAEGIPAESLQITPDIFPLLPPELADNLQKHFPDVRQDQRFGTNAKANMIVIEPVKKAPIS